jgi:hypothetical protein
VNLPAPWGLLAPLTAGAALSHGWRVAELTGVESGSCVLTLQNERGRTHRIHLCRNDGHPLGLVHTKHCDLLVMNGGGGELPTEEGIAQAVADVARALAANEARGAVQMVLQTLQPHAERLQAYAAAATLR